eukprot:6212369-Pleurochrysis_carterae.AAC.1
MQRGPLSSMQRSRAPALPSLPPPTMPPSAQHSLLAWTAVETSMIVRRLLRLCSRCSPTSAHARGARPHHTLGPLSRITDDPSAHMANLLCTAVSMNSRTASASIARPTRR